MKFTKEQQEYIEKYYLRCPLDADGVPIRVGDRLLKSTGAPKESFGEVVGVSEDSVWFVYENNGYESNWANLTRHVKPRTLEDVLEEYYDKRGWDEADNHALEAESLTSKYADEIRELLGGDAQ